MVSFGGFDTHSVQVNQADTTTGGHATLMQRVSDAIKAFMDDLNFLGVSKRVLGMTFSEFGRRVAQNASNGTDHGTANNMFFISGGLKQKGLINEMPDLANLDEGDLKFKVDFKNAYATVLKKWLNADDRSILTKQYDYLNFI